MKKQLCAAAALVGLLLAGCSINVDTPGAKVQVGPGGVKVDTPGAKVNVSPGDGVDVQTPGANVKVGPNSGVNVETPDTDVKAGPAGVEVSAPRNDSNDKGDASK